jgi:DNA-3-methyladenine glycosylase
VPLPHRFYLRSAPAVARDLLGCVLVSRIGGAVTAGRIVETEAYLGPEDDASHAAFRPSSHALFYGEGGRAYVYLNYGLHYCLNAITGRVGTPGCVLIRALEPVTGVPIMARRRRVPGKAPRLASGPGNLTRALGITTRENGADLAGGRLTIEPPGAPRRFSIAAGPRVGITRAREVPLRFWIAGHHCRSGSPAAPPGRSPRRDGAPPVAALARVKRATATARPPWRARLDEAGRGLSGPGQAPRGRRGRREDGG